MTHATYELFHDTIIVLYLTVSNSYCILELIQGFKLSLSVNPNIIQNHQSIEKKKEMASSSGKTRESDVLDDSSNHNGQDDGKQNQLAAEDCLGGHNSLNEDDNDDVDSTKTNSSIPVITDATTLLRYGICKVPIPKMFDTDKWSKELTQMTPEIIFGQGDSEYAFYRNILDEDDFPFDSLLFGGASNEEIKPATNTNGSRNSTGSMSKVTTSTIGQAMVNHFPIDDLKKEIQLDDAFCVHYNTDQDDTSGSKHMDPSDITVNMCLEKSNDTKGSHVLFYGTKVLENKNHSLDDDDVTRANSNTSSPPQQQQTPPETIDKFLVVQDPGYATIHYGDHLHETTSLECGRRTNIILTYCYTDPTRSDVATRSCY